MITQYYYMGAFFTLQCAVNRRFFAVKNRALRGSAIAPAVALCAAAAKSTCGGQHPSNPLREPKRIAFWFPLRGRRTAVRPSLGGDIFRRKLEPHFAAVRC
jgi:hypothetical protein